jgi:hypothetical protein
MDAGEIVGARSECLYVGLTEPLGEHHFSRSRLFSLLRDLRWRRGAHAAVVVVLQQCEIGAALVLNQSATMPQ